MLDRFYAICNRCNCCCLGMKNVFEYKMKSLVPSGYRAVLGDDCAGCKQCAENCQFDAIETISIRDNGRARKQCRVIPEKCFG